MTSPSDNVEGKAFEVGVLISRGLGKTSVDHWLVAIIKDALLAQRSETRAETEKQYRELLAAAKAVAKEWGTENLTRAEQRLLAAILKIVKDPSP